MAEKEAEIEKEEANRPKLDLSFKEGQTITVNLGVSSLNIFFNIVKYKGLGVFIELNL